MNQTQIEKANKDRASRWVRHLNNNGALINFSIGTVLKGQGKSRIVVNCPQDMPIEHLRDLCVAIITTIDGNKNEIIDIQPN
jgi:hypothetical protein